jgi:signal transduction histidine kinase
MTTGRRTSRSADVFPSAILRGERFLRTHPGLFGAVTVCFFAAIGVVHLRIGIDVPLAVTFAAPLALCTYSVGPFAGAALGVALATLWLVDALSLGVAPREALFVFGTRLFSNFGIVAVTALAAAAARARTGYFEAQQQLTRLRDDLVSAFSHDLRAPLTAIIGYASVLREGEFAEASGEVADALDRILVNATHLNHLIGDMLAAGSGEGSAPLRFSSFEPEELVSSLRTEFEDAARGPVQLVWQVAPHTPALRTDRSKLISIVRNLVGNALKFTRQGSVVVRLAYDPDAREHRLEVEDTGPGIPAEDLPRVFDRFYRAGQAKGTDGFGLGLFIVKRFTELMGGSVKVQSQTGRGTRFTLVLPQAAADKMPFTTEVATT